MPDTWMLAAVLVAVVLGYAAGRLRPGQRSLRWAEDRAGGSHGPGWWAAQVVGLAAVAWMVTIHPRRSAANRQSWREARTQQRSPAPTLDPHWPNRRTPGAPDA